MTREVVVKYEVVDGDTFGSIEDLRTMSPFIGFEPNDYKGHLRYLLARDPKNTDRFIAVKPTAVFGSAKHLRKAKGKFYIFDTCKELYDWLLEKETR